MWNLMSISTLEGDLVEFPSRPVGEILEFPLHFMQLVLLLLVFFSTTSVAAVATALSRRAAISTAAAVSCSFALPGWQVFATTSEALEADIAELEEDKLEERELVAAIRRTLKYEKYETKQLKYEGQAERNPLAIVTERTRNPFERLARYSRCPLLPNGVRDATSIFFSSCRSERIIAQESREADLVDGDNKQLRFLKSELEVRAH